MKKLQKNTNKWPQNKILDNFLLYRSSHTLIFQVFTERVMSPPPYRETVGRKNSIVHHLVFRYQISYITTDILFPLNRYVCQGIIYVIKTNKGTYRWKTLLHCIFSKYVENAVLTNNITLYVECVIE